MLCTATVILHTDMLKGAPPDTQRYNPSYTFTILPTTLCWSLDLPIQAFYIHGIAAA